MDDLGGFYEAALTCLRFVEHRTPTRRRFGADADAQWKTFHGHLATSHRIDLLLRDADAQFPGAFGGCVAFQLHGVAEGDAFESRWKSLPSGEASAVWKPVLAAPAPRS